MQVIVGCDGGGSKCHVRVALLGEDGAVLQTEEAITGPANVKSDSDRAIQNISAAVYTAIGQLQNSPTITISHFVLGLAGAGKVGVRESWQRKLSAELAIDRVTVVPDVEILFSAGRVGDDASAIATVVGTGSIAWARDGQGTATRAGGLGPDVGDEGSAFWIGREAIERLDPLFSSASSQSSSQIAQLCETVFARVADDEGAREIVEEAAAHISRLIIECGHALASSSENRIPWLCTGGVALNQPEWLNRVQELCEESRVFLDVPQLISEPVSGALNLALRSSQ